MSNVIGYSVETLMQMNRKTRVVSNVDIVKIFIYCLTFGKIGRNALRAFSHFPLVTFCKIMHTNRKRQLSVRKKSIRDRGITTEDVRMLHK